MAIKCNLILDSCCELPEEMWKRPGIFMLNFTYNENGKVYTDDMFHSRSAHEFYDSMRSGALPNTSQPSQMQFEHVFSEAIATGVPTVYLAFSSGISGCYEGAMVALSHMKEIHGEDVPLYVVDTKVGSTTESLLISEALRQRENGLTAKQMVAWAEEARYFVHTIFMVDGLDALRHGGRIPAAAAMLGTALNIKPLLSFDLEGRLSLVGVARGRKRGMRCLVDEYMRDHDTGAGVSTVAIGNADSEHDAERLRAEIEAKDENALFLMTEIGPTIGCHVGADMLSCCFWGSDRRNQISVSDKIAHNIKKNS